MAQARLSRSLCRPVIQIAPHVEAETCHEILQAMPQAVLLLDAELRVAFANRAAGTMFRSFSHRLVGHAITAILKHPNLDHLLADLSERPPVIEIFKPPANPGGGLRLEKHDD